MIIKIAIPIALRFIGLFLSFSLNVYLSRELDKSVLGLYFWLTQSTLVLSVFIRAGIDISLLKYGSIVSKETLFYIYKKYLKKIIVPLIFVLMFIVAISYIFLDVKTNTAILFVAVSLIPFTLFNLISEYFKSQNKHSTATIIQTCFLPVALFILMFIFQFEIFNAYMVSVITLATISIFMCINSFNNKKSNEYSEHDIDGNSIFIEARTFLVISVLNIVMNSMDMLMLGLMTSSNSVAEYGVANRLVALSSIILISINGIIAPKFSQLWKSGEFTKLYEYFIKITKCMALVSIVPLLLLYLSGEELLTIFFGEQYSSSYKLVNILSLGQAILLATGPVAYLLMMTNAKNTHKKSMYLAVIINLSLNLLLIPFYGAIGAAIATAASLIFKNIYSFCFLMKEFGIKRRIKL